MLINLWVKDKSNGYIHQVGTDVHDSVEFLDGQVVYCNMQNSASTLDEYEWIEAPDIDDYAPVVRCKDCKHWERLYYRPFVEPRDDGRCKALWQFHDAERSVRGNDTTRIF